MTSTTPKVKYYRVKPKPNVELSGYHQARICRCGGKPCRNFNSTECITIRIYDDYPDSAYTRHEDRNGSYWGAMLPGGLLDEETLLFETLKQRISLKEPSK